jgi:hypothetical protein
MEHPKACLAFGAEAARGWGRRSWVVARSRPRGRCRPISALAAVAAFVVLLRIGEHTYGHIWVCNSHHTCFFFLSIWPSSAFFLSLWRMTNEAGWRLLLSILMAIASQFSCELRSATHTSLCRALVMAGRASVAGEAGLCRARDHGWTQLTKRREYKKKNTVIPLPGLEPGSFGWEPNILTS